MSWFMIRIMWPLHCVSCKSPGRMALGPDKTNIKTLEPYSIQELAEIVKDRLLNKRMDYVLPVPQEDTKD